MRSESLNAWARSGFPLRYPLNSDLIRLDGDNGGNV